MCSRDINELDQIGKEFPSQALVIHMDLTNDYNCLDMKQTVIEKLGGIDILINCAGAIFNGDLENTFP